MALVADDTPFSGEWSMPADSLNGLLVLDKPSGITSRDAVDRAQHWFPRRTRLGHTGTLDPLATGVLVLGVGSATRLTEYVQQMTKTYQATIRLGARSDTDDADGTITSVALSTVPERSAVEECLRGFLGDIEQVPPAFSAAKITGERAYNLARKGEDVALAARKVHIVLIDIRRYEYPHLELEIRCGKGTYIRSLARDLGERLGCGGLIEVLRRTQVGPFHAEEALSIDADAATARSRLLPPAMALVELHRLIVPAEHARRLCQGGELPARVCQGTEAAGEANYAAFEQDGTLIGVVQIDGGSRQVRPVKILTGV
jgi:tRNA pseudouridine55 synthase